MFKKIRFLNFIIMLSAVLVIFGCAKTNRNIGTPQGITQSIPSTTSAIIPTPTPIVITTTPSGVVATILPPIELKNLQTNTLRVITDAGSLKWKDAYKRFKAMKAEVNALKPKLAKAGVNAGIISNIDMLISKLNTYITEKKAYETKLNANELMRYIADTMVVFKISVPPDTLRLDYYLRYIQYSLEKDDWAGALNHGNLASTMWKNLKGQITTKGRISSMNKIMSALDTSIKNKNKKTTLKEVKRALVSSASITKYFETKAKRL
jgi:hypothetical protein